METILSITPSDYVNSVYSSTSNKKAEESLETSTQTDTVEFSSKAFKALNESQRLASMQRSTEIMRSRGLSEEEISDFREIIDKAEQREGTAKEFLKSLSAKERDLVKRANHYGNKNADDLRDEDIDSFSEEGCMNLLVEQDFLCGVDLNNDCIFDNGSQKLLTPLFPPPDAPEKIKTTWEGMRMTMTSEERSDVYWNTKMVTPGDNTYPRTEKGWKVMLRTAYSRLDSINKLYPNSENLEKNKKTMACLQKLALSLDE